MYVSPPDECKGWTPTESLAVGNECVELRHFEFLTLCFRIPALRSCGRNVEVAHPE